MTPEQELLLAVLTQAVNDLGDKNDDVRNEAVLFFFSSGGGWERSRTNICEALGIDPEVLQQQMRRSGKVVTERPTADRRKNPFTPNDLLGLIPMKEFKMSDLDVPDTVSTAIAYDRIRRLIEQGVVTKMSATTYALTSFAPPSLPVEQAPETIRLCA